MNRNERILAVIAINLNDRLTEYIEKNELRFFQGGLSYNGSVFGYFKTMLSHSKKIEQYYKENNIQITDKDLTTTTNKLNKHRGLLAAKADETLYLSELDIDYLMTIFVSADWMNGAAENIKGLDNLVRYHCKCVFAYSGKIEAAMGNMEGLKIVEK